MNSFIEGMRAASLVCKDELSRLTELVEGLKPERENTQVLNTYNGVLRARNLIDQEVRRLLLEIKS